MKLDKHQLWITDDGCVLCIDHVVFSVRFNGRRATPADYAEHIESKGFPMACDKCEKSDDDREGFGNVYLLFGKNSPDRLQRARDAHPSRGKAAFRFIEKEEKA